MISEELKRLARLLNEMLDQSRHSPEPATEFDAASLIRDLVTLTRYQIAETVRLEIDAPCPLPVQLPESALRQALLNLILNAAEALESEPGVVSIKARKDAQGLHIDVIDNGYGFSEDILNYGIRPFRTSRQRGTGLGLAMVQRFVKDMGGSIRLTNYQPHGACVSIVLPNSHLAGDQS